MLSSSLLFSSSCVLAPWSSLLCTSTWAAWSCCINCSGILATVATHHSRGGPKATTIQPLAWRIEVTTTFAMASVVTVLCSVPPELSKHPHCSLPRLFVMRYATTNRTLHGALVFAPRAEDVLQGCSPGSPLLPPAAECCVRLNGSGAWPHGKINSEALQSSNPSHEESALQHTLVFAAGTAHAFHVHKHHVLLHLLG